VTFNNGEKGVADLSPILKKGGVFKPLKKQSEFAKFRLDKELRTIVWHNDADLAPEYVYFQTFKNVPELHEQFKAWGYIGLSYTKPKRLDISVLATMAF
jgi:hypothetical protein